MANAKKRTTTELTLADDPPRAADGMAQPEGLAALPQLLTDLTPAQMLAIAVQRGDGIDRLQQLMDLRQRWEADEARKAFNAAFAAFKSEAIKLVKNVTVKDGPLKGTRYADLATVVEAVTPRLSAHGLSISWKTTKDERDWMEITCILRHVDGHTETESMAGGPDNGPGRNTIQARASTRTYLEKYTALAILGLAAKGQDDDGAGSEAPGPYITPAQVQQLEAEVAKLGADRAGFLRHIRCESFAEVHASNFYAVLKVLREKKGAGKAGTTPPRSKSASVAERYAADALAILRQKIDSTGVMEGEVLERYTAASLEGLTPDQIEDALAWLARVV